MELFKLKNIEEDKSEFSIIGICKCGRSLSRTNLIITYKKPLLKEALMICGNCQTTYRFIVLEQHESRGVIK